MKETITKKQYLIYLGIMEMIRKNYNTFREYEKMLINIMGEENADYVTDEIYGTESFDMDVILDKCNLKVEDE